MSKDLMRARQIHLRDQALSEGRSEGRIKDVLGVDERTLKYYIKAMQE